MEKRACLFLVVISFCLMFMLSGEAFPKDKTALARTISPIVSTDWLADEIGAEDLVILDIRSPGEYAEGHISGSINEPFVTGFDPVGGPFSNWIVGSDQGLWLEVPEACDLFEAIGNLGITNDSQVVVVTAPNPDPEAEPPFYGFSNGTRVAFTLIYAGVKNVAVLDGGYPKWVAEGKDTSTEDCVPEPTSYQGKINKDILVSAEYVNKHLRKADIIDARDADVYFGVTIEPFADKAGHIPTAKCLPAPWIWAPDENGIYYTYKETDTLGAMAVGVLRKPLGDKGHKNQEILVYCGVGGYASSWWFLLTQVLGYQNVRLYDGAAQEWVKYCDMVPYKWE